VLERAGLSGAALERVSAFGKLLVSLNTLRHELPPGRFVEQLLTDTGLEKLFTEDKSVEAESRWKNLQELVSAVTEWQGLNPEGSLEQFLEDLALLSEQDRTDVGERVTLMTIHAAKGLEFQYVLITGLEDGVFPIVREDTTDADLEEERRLFYVAVTRAKDQLALSACRSRMLYGRTQIMEPSRFLFEVPRTLIDMKAGTANEAPNGALRYNEAPIASGPQPGDRVRHNLFGEGEVTGVSREDGKVKLLIRFLNVGVKKIAAQYVELL
jgi:DNA helicase-2/ATP-dependent DNA helicase PcrA